MTTTLVIEECAGCVTAFAAARDARGSTFTCTTCAAKWSVGTSARPVAVVDYPTQFIPQRTAPARVAREALPIERNRRVRERPWNLVADMALLAKCLPAIEGRACGMEPGVQGGGQREENDKRQREMATAVLIHTRLCTLSGAHRAVIRFALIERDGSKLGDDDEKTAPAVAKARETAFERLAVAFATKAQRATWKKQPRSASQKGMRDTGRRLFVGARAAYER